MLRKDRDQAYLNLVAVVFVSYSVVSNSFVTPQTVARQAPLSSWDYSGKNAEVSCHFYLQWRSSRPRDLTYWQVLAGGFFSTKPLGIKVVNT